MWFAMAHILLEIKFTQNEGESVLKTKIIDTPLSVAAVDFVLQLISLSLSLSPQPLSRGQFLDDGNGQQRKHQRETVS